MEKATLAQGNQILNLILQKKIPSEQVQRVLESGLLSDILDANLEFFDELRRDDIRRILGLCPLSIWRRYENRQYLGIAIGQKIRYRPTGEETKITKIRRHYLTREIVFFAFITPKGSESPIELPIPNREDIEVLPREYDKETL